MDSVEECASYLLCDLYRTLTITLSNTTAAKFGTGSAPLPLLFTSFVLSILTFEAWGAPPPGALSFPYLFTSYITRLHLFF